MSGRDAASAVTALWITRLRHSTIAGPTRFAAVLVTLLLLAAAAWLWAFGWFGPPNWRANAGDLTIYTNATARLLGGGYWYLDRQLVPYEIAWGDVLYPPAAAWFFAPWLVLPGWTFVAIPAAITAWAVYRMRPAWWAWPLMALCLLWPVTGLKVLSANPNVWVMAFAALGALRGWPAALILLKPSLLPFALFGIRSRAWWIVAAGLALLSVPFLAETLAYPAVILRSHNPDGFLYSLADVPLILIPVIAWFTGSRRGTTAP